MPLHMELPFEQNHETQLCNHQTFPYDVEQYDHCNFVTLRPALSSAAPGARVGPVISCSCVRLESTGKNRSPCACTIPALSVFLILTVASARPAAFPTCPIARASRRMQVPSANLKKRSSAEGRSDTYSCKKNSS